MTDRALDNLLRQVLLDADSQEYGDAINELPEHDFSPAFEKKMQKLIRRANHPIRYRVAQAAACLLLAALLSGCTVLAISPEARDAFVGWVREVSEGWFVYHYTGKDQTAPENVVYCPTWVPDGYELITEPEARTHMTAIYENSEGDRIIFNCSFNTESINFQIEREGVQRTDTYVDNIPADLYIDNTSGNANCIVWENESQQIIFWIISTLDGETMIKIAESVEAQEIPKPQEVYRPTWIPGGYSQALVPELSGQVNVLYKDDKGHTMLFAYADSSSTLYVGSLDSAIATSKVTVNDIPADFYLDADETQANFLVWVNPENDIIFWIGGNFSEDILIRVAECVAVVQ